MLSQEIAIKNRPGAWRHWEWSMGVSGFRQRLDTNGPVTFQSEGVQWVNANMNKNANAHMPEIVQGPMKMQMLSM